MSNRKETNHPSRISQTLPPVVHGTARQFVTSSLHIKKLWSKYLEAGTSHGIHEGQMSDSEERPTAMPSTDAEKVEVDSSLDNGNEATENLDPPKAPTAMNARTCAVCFKNPAKYKCTRCELPYCSIPCNVEHKNNHPAETEIPKVDPPAIKQPDSSSANGWKSLPLAGTRAAAFQPPNVLAPLLASPELQQLFTRYPSLKAQLGEIYAASQPPVEDQWSEHRERPFWTTEQGTRDGVEALKNAKRQYGQDGEGIKEFAALVLRYVSPENAVNGSFDQPSPIYRETQEDNAKMISDLLKGELGNS